MFLLNFCLFVASYPLRGRSLASMINLKIASASLGGRRDIFWLDYSNQMWGPAATRALPASLFSYFLKFLIKREARSSAFLYHSSGLA